MKIRLNPRKLKKYTIVVTCVVMKRLPGHAPKVLILKRSKKEREGPGLWTIPGGKLAPNDWGKPLTINGSSHTIWLRVGERAVRREAKEETGIVLRKIFLMQGREKVFLRKDKTPTLVLVFSACCSPHARVRLGKESGGFCWVTRGELEKYDFIGNVKDDIKTALERKAKIRRRR